MIANRQELEQQEWLQSAFRGDIPPEVQDLLESRNVSDNVLVEIMTQCSSELRRPLQRLYDLHRAETALLYCVVENLFKRHLAEHP